jgi:hypothetical protein
VLIDVLVPTRLTAAAELPFRHNLTTKFREIVELGIAAKLSAEVGRWSDYFFISNAAHLVFVGLGASGLVASIVRSDDPRRRTIRLALLAALLAAPVAMVLDPHETPSHAVPLALLAYIASGVGLLGLLDVTPSRFLRSGLVALGILALLIKGAHASQLIRSSVAGGVSNRNVAAFVRQSLEPGANQLAVAPTLLWPYVDPTRSVVLIDPGSRAWEPTDPRLQSISMVILDRDFLARGWNAVARAMVQCGAFVKTGSLGQRGGDFYLEAYRVAGPCRAGSN